MQHDAASPKPRRRRLSDESSKRDGGGGGGSGSGKEESSRKRRRRILSCDTCRRQKCRCELDEESEACSRCRSLRIKHLEASIADLKTTVQMLAASVRPDVRRAIHSSRSERQPADRRGSIVEPHDTVHTAGAASVAGGSGPKAPANEDVEPADKHVYSSPAEVVRKVGSQLSGGYRRTFDVQADLVSLGILDDKTAKDLVIDWAATTGRPATVPSAYLQQCKLLLNFEEVTMRDAMVYAEIGLYLILQDKLSQRLYLAHDGECEEIAAWKARWNYLFELPAASTLRISHSIAWMILARRSLEHDQASSDQDSLSSSPRLQPADAARPEPLAQQHNELHDLMHARVCSFATDVVRAFVEMPSTRAEELPEFHRLCVAYAMLIISKYEQKSAANDGGGGGLGGSEEVLQLLQAAQKQNMVWSASSPSAIQFGLERALKKVTSRVEGARGVAGVSGGGVSLVGGATGVTPAADERAPHRPKVPSPRAMRDHPNATPSTSTWTQHNTQVREQQLPPQHGTPSSFTGNTLVPEFDGSLSLETMDFFFSGGHLGLGDNSFF
ncbi:hypothetical protein CTRI78_v003435 [Colletotrichum trifolii]|uniref:Transcriptional activator of proteases prtT n=1 Tax=Colletotrichum trifolii TaxID=5466 RepID=A0A4R8RJJ9_COLTR|nr:hypothetical protein CTRI78_v003435 [Colletotrichum trifolii]